MARTGRLTFSCMVTGFLLATALLPDFLGAGPVGERLKGDVGDAAPEEKAASPSALKKLTRNRRDVSWHRRLPDFWTWYKFFMNTGNQEGVEDLDRIYLNYLQNKHRVEEGGPSFNHYLQHLGEIYKLCADSDDPECLAEQTSKPKAKVVMPKPAPLKTVCDPFTDPYCLFARMVAAKLPTPASQPPAPAPVKGPSPILAPLLPLPGKAPLGYYYAPVLEPFLSAEQRGELLRICNPSDVECLQYHLRAAYGYRPAAGPAPSYAHLSCDPTKNPYCKPTLVQKAPSGLYHLYPTCDPDFDPFCKPGAPAPAPQTAESEEAPKEQVCNPLFDDNCNPLTATKLAGITRPVLEYTPKEEPAMNLACDPRYDPYCLIGAAAALLKPPAPLPQDQTRPRLGFKGKTKEGYDCYLFYDEGCFPPTSKGESKAPEAPASDDPDCHPYDPTCGRFAPQALSAPEANKPAKDGVIEPHPDCDPEYDYNCRLRRAEPEAAATPAAEEAPQEDQVEEESKDEPVRQEEPLQEAPGFDPYQSGQGDPYASYVAQDHAVPSFEDFLRGYADQYGRYDSFSGGYKKK
ncbi:hypothetical protein ANANG_G00124630 [Anguilla anguilla]|uniref:Actinodin2 n=1 Tax=Anguilla anguilla TaxID=7936 RepID=A0A9D3ME41_ANGAN|nr:hypothetical protein ANANG_G00124630 [Anguilla anguilla]